MVGLTRSAGWSTSDRISLRISSMSQVAHFPIVAGLQSNALFGHRPDSGNSDQAELDLAGAYHLSSTRSRRGCLLPLRQQSPPVT